MKWRVETGVDTPVIEYDRTRWYPALKFLAQPLCQLLLQVVVLRPRASSRNRSSAQKPRKAGVIISIVLFSGCCRLKSGTFDDGTYG